ncbi:hypothetical protein D3C84_828590 [compost metagenome]
MIWVTPKPLVTRLKLAPLLELRASLPLMPAVTQTPALSVAMQKAAVARALVTSDQVAPSSVLRASEAAIEVDATQTPAPSVAIPKTALLLTPRVTSDQVCPASTLRIALPLLVPASQTPAPLAASRHGKTLATPYGVGYQLMPSTDGVPPSRPTRA